MNDVEQSTHSVWSNERGDIDLDELHRRDWPESHLQIFSWRVEQMVACCIEIPTEIVDHVTIILQEEGLEMLTVHHTLLDMVGVNVVAVRARHHKRFVRTCLRK